jgi:hypothetical protein
MRCPLKAGQTSYTDGGYQENGRRSKVARRNAARAARGAGAIDHQRVMICVQVRAELSETAGVAEAALPNEVANPGSSAGVGREQGQERLAVAEDAK